VGTKLLAAHLQRHVRPVPAGEVVAEMPV
jgi:hypothetical protein